MVIGLSFRGSEVLLPLYLFAFLYLLKTLAAVASDQQLCPFKEWMQLLNNCGERLLLAAKCKSGRHWAPDRKSEMECNATQCQGQMSWKCLQLLNWQLVCHSLQLRRHLLQRWRHLRREWWGPNKIRGWKASLICLLQLFFNWNVSNKFSKNSREGDLCQGCNECIWEYVSREIIISF